MAKRPFEDITNYLDSRKNPPTEHEFKTRLFRVYKVGRYRDDKVEKAYQIALTLGLSAGFYQVAFIFNQLIPLLED